MGGKSGEEKNSDVIVEYRLKNGLCHGCGARIYDISNGRVSPLTIKGVVREGRCLFCYPDTGAEEKKDTPKDKGKRKVDKTLSSSDKTKPFRGRLRSDPEQPPAAPAIKKEIVEDGSNQKHSPAAPAIKEKNVPATPAIKKEILDDVSSSGRDISTDTSVARLPQRPIPSKEEEEEDSSDDEQVKIKMHNINRKSSSSRDVSIADIDGNIYHGTVTKGNTQKGSGLFRFVYSKGPFEGKDSTYEGEFENGLMEGHGTSRDAVCCVYTGEYHKGAAHGNGNCTWAGNWKYEGEWKMDEREGHGKLWQDVKNGEVYEGEWKDDQWNGLGELKFSVGGRYIGEFKNHHLDGQGRVSCCRQRRVHLKRAKANLTFLPPLLSMSSETAACTRAHSRTNTEWVTES
jgi:hypothetical protein